MAHSDDHWMQAAIAVARAGIAQGQSPFGCVIVEGDAVDGSLEEPRAPAGGPCRESKPAPRATNGSDPEQEWRATLAACHNQVWAQTDPTAHAEVTAIRAACARRGTITLVGCRLYSTCEPCPMCMAAIHWARIERVVFGAAIADAAAAGFHELALPAAELLRQGGSPVQLVGGCLASDCRQLFADWLASGRARAY